MAVMHSNMKAAVKTPRLILLFRFRPFSAKARSLSLACVMRPPDQEAFDTVNAIRFARVAAA